MVFYSKIDTELTPQQLRVANSRTILRIKTPCVSLRSLRRVLLVFDFYS